MKSVNAQWVVRATGGKLLKGRPELEFPGFSTDTRALKTGELFLALKGEQLDGHSYLSQAKEAGAGGVVVSERLEEALELFDFVLKVDDTLMAWCGIGRLAFRDRPVKVVAVTGSTGKTTTKGLIAQLLGGRFKVHKSPASFNNEVGIPLTVLSMPDDTEVAVLEYGTRNPGDIALLCEIAEPSIAVITNIQESHLGRFGTRDALFDAKAELVDHMETNGTAILNADERWFKRLRGRVRGQVLSFGRSLLAEVSATRVRANGEGLQFRILYHERSVEVSLPLLGAHNVYNALAATAVGLAMGLELSELAERFAAFQPEGKRLTRLLGQAGQVVLDDSYNASPASVRAALEVLGQLDTTGRRIAVLGDMLELGPEEALLHQEVGGHMIEQPLDLLITVGELAARFAEGAVAAGFPEGAVVNYLSLEEAFAGLPEVLHPGDLVLVKGSRAVGLERLVELLVNG